MNSFSYKYAILLMCNIPYINNNHKWQEPNVFSTPCTTNDISRAKSLGSLLTSMAAEQSGGACRILSTECQVTSTEILLSDPRVESSIAAALVSSYRANPFVVT